MQNSLQNFVEKIVAGLSVLFCVGIAILDFGGLLDGIPIIAGRVPIISLLLLSGITSYFIFIAPEKDNSRHTDLLNQISQIDNVFRQTLLTRVQVFKDFDSCLTYTNNRIKRARTNVSSVYWDASLNFSQVIAKNVLHREIFIIDESNRQQYQDELENRVKTSGRNHSCAYYRVAKDVSMQFVVIDATEVIFLSNLPANNIAIQHPQIINLLQNHYEEMWNKATKIKMHERINYEKVNMATMKSITRPISIPYSEDLEKCIKKCLEAHEKAKSLRA